MRVKVFHAPASETTTGARNSARASCFAFPYIYRDAHGAAAFQQNAAHFVVGQEFAARRADHGAVALAISPAPPAGYHAPFK